MNAAKNHPNKTLALLVSLGISAGLIGFLITQLDWAAFRVELHRVNIAYLPALVLLFFALMLVRALRWRELIPSTHPRPVRDLLEATLLGFLASFVLPLRAGEVVRPWALSRWQAIPLPTTLASIVTERLWDALTLLALLGFTLLRMNQVPELVVVGARTLGAICVVLLVIMTVCYVAPTALPRTLNTWLHRWFPRRPERTDRITQIATSFVQGLRVVSGPLHLLRVAALSLLIWLMMALWYQLALWAFGEHPSWLVGMLLNLMIALAVAAPSAPGFIGTFQAGCLVALTVISGYSREFAMAYSVVTHVLQMTLVLGAGFVVLHLRGLRLAQLGTPPLTPPGTISR